MLKERFGNGCCDLKLSYTLTDNVESPYKEDYSNLYVDPLVGSPTGTP